jgi:2-polyprenyl-6-methoxyphenol hydroxylase-like FAD-dependent oxidoreductase
MNAPQKLRCRCCVVGGGPAGMMLGLLLGRAGIDVVVLEKHEDFLRDFRGDTVHPSTLEIMKDIGLLDELLALPHQEARHLTGQVGDWSVTFADFTHLRTACRFVALMPQWDFLNLLAASARRFPTFTLLMEHAATDLIVEHGLVVGVRADTPAGSTEIRADLVIGADGRRSIVRERAGLVVEDLGAPMDVLWFRLERRPSDPSEPVGRFDPGQIFVLINRGDYFQCGLVIPKGQFEQIKADGIEAFRARVAKMLPSSGERANSLASFDDVKLLTVTVDRLQRWYKPGLLCIGDAAHAMSPIGGVGINLAVQDAVAAANILFEPLRRGGPVPESILAAVQKRRELPTRLIQRLQILIQDRIIRRALGATGAAVPPWPLRLLAAVPLLQRIPARIVGLGFRRERVSTPVAVGAEKAPSLPRPIDPTSPLP